MVNGNDRDFQKSIQKWKWYYSTAY
jgi:hypothetical protein